jgi:hypothetical protein
MSINWIAVATASATLVVDAGIAWLVIRAIVGG